MRIPLPALSPLAFGALVVSLAAHGSLAMYVAKQSGGRASATEVAPSLTVETVDVETVEEAPPALPTPPVVPDVAPEALSRQQTPKPNVVIHRAESATTPSTPTESAPAAAAAVVSAAADDAPTFAMVMGTAVVAPGGATKTVGADSYAPPAAPLLASGVDQLARLVSGPPPSYPTSARDNGVEADVPLDIVVDDKGRVVDVHQTRHLGYGLDESAAEAIRHYRFAPALLGGHAVPVRMRWTVVFRLS